MKKKLIKEAKSWGIVTPKALNNPTKRISLSELAKETWEPKQEAPQLSPEDKKAFMEAINNFGGLSSAIYREQTLQEITEKIKSIVEQAAQVTVTETEDWFDRVTVQRHMKQLGESYKTFEKTAKQLSELQQRLEACYEDIGSTLGRYYKINEFEQKPEDTNMSDMVKENKLKKKDN